VTELCQLGFLYRTDKAGNYTPLYDLFFRDRREAVRKVLEIGIGSIEAMGHVPDYVIGASLYMWRDYFPNASIYGLDVNPATLISGDRIHTRQCNQAQGEDLQAALAWSGGGFDLVVDDGSHDPQHQVNTALALVPHLSPGGLYIIEDVNNLEEVSSQLPFRHSAISYKNSPRLTGRLIVISHD
jgi:hypothetical protein